MPETGLTGRRAWQEPRQGNEIDTGSLCQPLPPLNEFGAKIAESDRSTKASAAKPQKAQPLKG
jgi:hypothetical protein